MSFERVGVAQRSEEQTFSVVRSREVMKMLDALQLVIFERDFERGSPKAEPAARRWLETAGHSSVTGLIRRKESLRPQGHAAPRDGGTAPAIAVKVATQRARTSRNP